MNHNPPPNAANPVSARLLADLRYPQALSDSSNPVIPWLWHGYLARGKVTLLTSQWKSGKTTLVSVLLQRFHAGGLLAGLSVAPAKVVVVSEESPNDWHCRCQHLAIRDNVQFLCRPFRAKPTQEEWLALVEALGTMRTSLGTDLVVIDPLAAFLPGNSENAPGSLLNCLIPLQRLATGDLALLLLHHPSKGQFVPGQAARGTGALAAFVDIIVEMTSIGKSTTPDRRRRLRAYSRYGQTPPHLILELNADATDYIAHTAAAADDCDAPAEDYQGFLFVLRTAVDKLTRPEILERWPQDFPKPDATTIWRWLARGVEQGTVLQDGTGRRSEPHRYWLAEREPMLCPGLDASPQEKQAWNDKLVADALKDWQSEQQTDNPVVAGSTPVVAGSPPVVAGSPPVVAGSPDPATSSTNPPTALD